MLRVSTMAVVGRAVSVSTFFCFAFHSGIFLNTQKPAPVAKRKIAIHFVMSNLSGTDRSEYSTFAGGQNNNAIARSSGPKDHRLVSDRKNSYNLLWTSAFQPWASASVPRKHS